MGQEQVFSFLTRLSLYINNLTLADIDNEEESLKIKRVYACKT